MGIQIFGCFGTIFDRSRECAVGNGLCPVHHGLPVNDESEAMARAMIKSYNPTGNVFHVNFKPLQSVQRVVTTADTVTPVQ